MNFLPPDKIEELTGKKKRPAQVRALRKMGIHHHVRPDGFPIVIESALGSPEKSGKIIDPQPDWSSLNAQG